MITSNDFQHKGIGGIASKIVLTIQFILSLFMELLEHRLKPVLPFDELIEEVRELSPVAGHVDDCVRLRSNFPTHEELLVVSG